MGRDDSWVAIAVSNDTQWSSLCEALGKPEWADDPELTTMEGRVREHDRIDAFLDGWCRDKTADDVVGLLWDAGVPVGRVIQPHFQPNLPQLASRGFFEDLDHPVAGTARYCTLPMTFSRGPARRHVRHAPLLGEHTDQLLGELGLTRSEIDALSEEGIIGGWLAAPA